MLEYHAGARDRLEEMNRDLAPRDDLPDQPAAGRIAPHALTSKPPSRDRIGAWRERMGPEDVAEFEAEAGDMLSELGYELSSAGPAGPGREAEEAAG